MTMLSDLITGKMITKIQVFEDYASLSFSNGKFLNIYNNYTINKEFDDYITPIEVLTIKEQETCIVITLTGEVIINIGMKDVDFRGPEAMSYRGCNGQSITWP